MIHTFYVVFMRQWSDDADFVLPRAEHLPLTEAILQQLGVEISDPSYHGRFDFSSSILFQGDTYYCLGRIDFEHGGDESEAWDAFVASFQKTYDVHGAAGSFQIAKAHLTDKLKTRWADLQADHWYPCPPWTTEPVMNSR